MSGRRTWRTWEPTSYLIRARVDPRVGPQYFCLVNKTQDSWTEIWTTNAASAQAFDTEAEARSFMTETWGNDFCFDVVDGMFYRVTVSSTPPRSGT